MEPTARALDIAQLLSPALDSISTAVSRASTFDPATSTQVFRIGLTDEVEFALLPPLLRRLRAEAPDVVLVVRRANYLLMPGLLASGEISVGVCYTEELPANAKRKVLRRPKPMLLRADSIPGRLSMEDYCSRPHAMVSFAGDLNGYIDENWPCTAASARWCWRCRSSTAASLLAGTDIIATVPDYAAAALAANGGVRAEPCPSRPAGTSNCPWRRGAQDNDDPPNAGCARVSRCSSATRIVCREENGAAYSTRKRPTHCRVIPLPCPAASLMSRASARLEK